MKYEEAVQLLLSGKYVSRIAWQSQNGYLAYLPGLSHFLQVVTQPSPNVTAWAAEIDSSNAEDWIEIQPFTFLVDGLKNKQE